MQARIFAVAAVFGVAGFGSVAAAQETERAALAREVVELLQVTETIDDVMANLAPLMAENIGNQIRLSPSETGRLQEILVEEFRASGPEMAAGIADIYATRMSEPQLREVAVFLRSPTGLAFIEVQNSAEGALEEIGGRIGAQVGLRAITRLQAEQAEDRSKD
jgi:hypothetical protein